MKTRMLKSLVAKNDWISDVDTCVSYGTGSYIDQGTGRVTARINWINAFRQCMVQGLTIYSTTFNLLKCLFFVLIFGKVSSAVIICESIISVTTTCLLWAQIATVCGFCIAPITHWVLFHALSKWFQWTGLTECHLQARHCGEIYALHGGTAVQLRLVDMSMSDKRRVRIEHSCVLEQRKNHGSILFIVAVSKA